mgnify:CR=1 FL=1
MLKQVFEFLKNPIYEEDTNNDFKYRLNVFFRLLVYALAISFVLGMFIGGLETLFGLDFGKHAIEDFMDTYSPWFLFGAAVLLAPLFEESLFRGPFLFFKGSRFFKLAFYLFTLVFGFYHITNFELTPTTLALSPLLVAPQLCIGVFLGFIRIRFGLLWAIALHACYNLIIVGPVILMQILDIPLE